jgi:hypothetical protein
MRDALKSGGVDMSKAEESWALFSELLPLKDSQDAFVMGYLIGQNDLRTAVYGWMERNNGKLERTALGIDGPNVREVL